MKSWVTLCFLISLFLFLQPGCSKDNDEETPPSDVWDIDAKGIPMFVRVNYIELDKIYRISRFRSSVGHDYSDAFEQCRSMKHYFEPKGTVDWTTVKIYSPVKGTITRVEQEWAGTKLEIASDSLPAFRFSIFHFNPANSYIYIIGQKVAEGEYLGMHIGSQTMSDISVIVNDPTHQGRMVSFFSVITDQVFNAYLARGVPDRDGLIISREERDANPLECSGDTFISSDTLQNWMILN
jgi:hypothetical protein